MKKTIILIFLTLAFFLAALPVFSSEEEKSLQVKVAVLKHFPPQYSLSKTGKPQGFAIDIIEEIAKLAKLDIEYVVKDSWSDMFESVKSGKADLIPNQGITDRRDQWFDYSQPVETFPISIFVRKHGEGFQTIEDLIGKKVAVIKLNIGEALVKKHPNIVLQKYDYAEKALFSLLSGSVDAMIFPTPVLWKIARDAKIDDKIKVTGKPLLEIKRAISVVKDNKLLLQRINTAVEQFVGSNRYNEIYTHWYGKSEPYWTTKKIWGSMFGLLFFVTLFMGIWRYRSIAHLNLELNKNIANRVSAEKQLQEAYDSLEEKVDQRTAELLDANSKYIKAQQLGKVGNWEYDIVNQKFLGSSEAIKIYGFPDDKFPLTPERVESCIPERELVHQGLVDLIENDVPYNLEFDIIAEDSGKLKTVNSRGELQRDESGNPVKIQGVILDITERRKSEVALRKSEDRYRELFENAPFPYQSLDEHGCILEVNTRWLNHLEYSRNEVVGNSFGDYLHPNWEGHFRENFPKFKSVGEILGIEFQMKKKDGSYIWVSFNGKIRRDHAGKFVQTYCIFNDISEQKKLQEKINLQNEALNQSRKMESVGQLAGGVAHDFNNMLSIILGYTEMALEKLETSDPLYGDLEEIYQAGMHSADITRQLLAFARQQTIDPKVLNLNENINSMIKMLRHLIGEDIDLSWIPGTGLCSVKIDPSQIDQILANLSVNARDAITDIGKVTIETKNVTFDENYCNDHTGFIPGEYVMLAVSDDGCGIAPETMNQVFEPFFTTKKVGEGTGLGLATVYGIVKQNNGFINIYSEPQKGTTIRVYLPQYSEQVVKEQNVSTSEMPQTFGETILLVEDDASLLKLGIRTLENLGYKVLSTTRSKDAKKIVEEYDGQINLLLTDVVMPEMNGRELSEQLQHLYPQLKILFMSGYTANVIAHRGVLDEDINFIPKPFSTKDIAIKIREVLD